jgi:hypothetical protein
MSREGVKSLRQLLTTCKDVFRLKLDANPPAIDDVIDSFNEEISLTIDKNKAGSLVT